MTDRSTEEFAAKSSPSQDTIPLAKQFQVMSETKKKISKAVKEIVIYLRKQGSS